MKYTARLDKALRIAARSHEQQNQHRKGSDIPYIIHPVGVMMLANEVTEDEDILIACLFHDILEDVAEDIYGEDEMQMDFGEKVVEIVKHVTKSKQKMSWRDTSLAYLDHLESEASDQAIIVSACDKLHNIISINIDYDTHGDQLWQRFSTKSEADQIWWYKSVLKVLVKRQAPKVLTDRLGDNIDALEQKVSQS